MKPGDPITVTMPLPNSLNQSSQFASVVMDLDNDLKTVEVSTDWGARVWIPQDWVKPVQP